jgi:hypothetical protein
MQKQKSRRVTIAVASTQTALATAGVALMAIRLSDYGTYAVVAIAAAFIVGLVTGDPIGTLYTELRSREFACQHPGCTFTVRVTHPTPEDPALFRACAADHPNHPLPDPDALAAPDTTIPR